MWGEDTSLPPVTLQHVGERWYQPGIGRFIQRDPIGLDGGLNVYAYCADAPLSYVDPDGLYTFGDLQEYWTRGGGSGGVPPGVSTALGTAMNWRRAKVPGRQLGSAAGKTKDSTLWYANCITKRFGNRAGVLVRRFIPYVGWVLIGYDVYQGFKWIIDHPEMGEKFQDVDWDAWDRATKIRCRSLEVGDVLWHSPQARLS